MSERIYAWLLRLYPRHFRDAYSEQSLQLFRDRARDERGFFLTLRRWLDLLTDLAASLPYAYRQSQARLLTVPEGTPVFHIFTDETPRTGAMIFGVLTSLLVFAALAVAARYTGPRRPITDLISFSRQMAVPFVATDDSESMDDLIVNGQPSNGKPARTLWPALMSLFADRLKAQPKSDTSPHAVQFVTVDQDVKLEVLDWGGAGRPLILLAGAGNTAHIYDKFAPKLTPQYHVYGITRRGSGASSQPEPSVANYSATRLGNDVLAVIDALKLNRPVLVGHSLAGEELSSIGSRHRDKVAGLVYLDAGYAFAYYDRAHGDLWLDMIDLRKRIDDLQSGVGDRKQTWQDIAFDVERLGKPLDELTQVASMPTMRTPPAIDRAIQFGWERHTDIKVPILAIFAIPPKPQPRILNQINAFEAGLPNARVVRLNNAEHYLFNSNESDVLREMNTFLANLH